MGWQVTLYTVPLLVAGVVGGVVAALVFSHRPKSGATMLAVNLGGNALWALGQAAAVSATTVSGVLAGTTASLVGIVALAPSWLVFAVQYTGYRERVGWPTFAVAWIPGIAFVALALVAPVGTFYVDPQPAGATAEFAWGPAKWALTGWAYLVGGAGLALLAGKMLRSRNVYRKRTFVLFTGGSAVLIGHAIAMSGLSPTPLLTLSPLLYLGFALVTLLVIVSDRFLRLLPVDRLVGALGGRFANIGPIARDLVIEQMGSGVVVLDGDNRVVDLNPMARTMLGTGDARIVGRRVEDVIDRDAFLVEDPEFFDPDVRSGSYDGVWVETRDGRRCFDLVITDVAERRDDVDGRVAIIHDVTDQQERQRQLQRRTTQLERQNERLEEFASIVSHDLRNPLNVASGRLELLDEDDLATDQAVEQLAAVRDAHGRMERIIDDMLALAREGQTVDETTSVPLAHVAREAWTTVDTGDATLDVDVADETTLEADESRLTQVFENLYRNAVDHGAPGEDTEATDVTVRVDALGDPDDPRGFFVADDGVGLDDETASKAFEQGFSTDDDGTGFGLSIVESVVEAHGGNVAITDSDGGGARFEIRLPRDGSHAVSLSE